VEIDSTGDTLYGFLWQQDDKKPEVAILLMHGLTGSPSSPLFGKMAPVLAQYELAVLAIESHRSGWAGHESALLEQDTSDIDNWIAFLINRGYKKIVLAGASMGSVSIGRYQAVKQHPDVVGLAHLMPTADGAAWFEQAAGSGAYAQAVADAQQAIENGTGDSELIDVDVRQPPPSLSQGRFRWTQRAASWLSWWGPEADSNNTQHFANAQVPLLLISGTADSYNDEKRFAQIRSAAINAPSVDEIWYQDIDHGLAGVERQVADDIGEWLNKLGIINT
jgi:alpha-beta hydrolase superfamily lysophospholipase